MWEGALHMPRAPTYEHRRTVDELMLFLAPLLKRRKAGALRAGINVFRHAAPREDYRIPDLTFIAAGNERIIAEDGTRGGGPDAVIEVRSPSDETYEKLSFFAALGVREVVVVDRDTKKPEVYRLAGDRYLAVSADRDGRVTSEVLGVRFRAVEGCPGLEIEDLQDPATRTHV
jgi:Uma2 family endonuclease